jgi:threonine/homoserine/homoserine lactone efflux protein
MESLAKVKGMVDYKKYLRMLVLSTAIAFLTLYIAFGLMFFVMEGNTVPGWFILLTFAVFFIIFTVFYESKSKSKSKGKDKTKEKSKESFKPLIKGLFLGICATFAFVAVIGGVSLTIDPQYGLDLIGGFGSFVSALAICMIVNMVFLSLLRPS